MEHVVKRGATVVLHEYPALPGFKIGAVIPPDAVELTHAQALSLEAYNRLCDEDAEQLLFGPQRGTRARTIVGQG